MFPHSSLVFSPLSTLLDYFSKIYFWYKFFPLSLVLPLSLTCHHLLYIVLEMFPNWSPCFHFLPSITHSLIVTRIIFLKCKSDNGTTLLITLKYNEDQLSFNLHLAFSLYLALNMLPPNLHHICLLVSCCTHWPVCFFLLFSTQCTITFLLHGLLSALLQTLT